jgi:hypothetical protein
VEPSLLARGVTKIRTVNLFCTRLTGHQLESILHTIEGRQSALKVLYVGYHDFSMVDASLLARASNKLESLDLHDTQLTTDQVELILAHSLVETSLQRLRVSSRDFYRVDDGLAEQASHVIGQMELDEEEEEFID